jgi:hypothetical protein
MNSLSSISCLDHLNVNVPWCKKVSGAAHGCFPDYANDKPQYNGPLSPLSDSGSCISDTSVKSYTGILDCSSLPFRKRNFSANIYDENGNITSAIKREPVYDYNSDASSVFDEPSSRSIEFTTASTPVTVTDVTCNGVTVTIKECATRMGFFSNHQMVS